MRAWWERRSRFAWWPEVLAGGTPALLVAYTYQLAWLASLQLDRWPVPYRDDPKSLAAPIPTLLWVWYLLFCLWPPSMLASLGVAGLRAAQRRWARAAGALLALIAVHALALALLRWDPLRVVDWIMD
jgi:hypothetical protein